MAITSAGYAGTVNDAQWARLARYHGSGYAVRDRASFACAVIGTSRTFSVSAGEACAFGILDTNDAPVTLAPTLPASGGRWYLIALRRTWLSKVSALVIIPHTTTTTTVPTAAPTTLPANNSAPGSVDDQPLFFVWANATTTSTLVVDLRELPASVKREGSGAERDAYFGTINLSSTAGQRYLQRIGARWLHTGLRYVQEYLGTYEASENFAGVVQAGWYPAQGTRPSVEFYTVAKTIPSATDRVVGSSLFPWDGGVDRFGWVTALGRFQPDLPGIYRLRVQDGFAGTAGTNVATNIRLNGNTFIVVAGRNAFDDFEQYLNGSTDYLDIVIWQGSGAAQNVRMGLVRMEYVGPLRTAFPAA